MKPVLSFGRIMLGLAYVVYGYLHFAHTAADAAMVPQGVGRPVVWVILIGICWWAVALSFFTNILTRLSGVLASVLLFLVLFFAILPDFHGVSSLAFDGFGVGADRRVVTGSCLWGNVV